MQLTQKAENYTFQISSSCSLSLSLPLYEDFCILRTNLREWNQEMGHYKNTLAHITHTKANDSGFYADIEIMQHYCTETLYIALSIFQTK